MRRRTPRAVARVAAWPWLVAAGLASCGDATTNDMASTYDAGVDAPVDAAQPGDGAAQDVSDAGCASSTDGCAPRDPCDEVDWCPVATGLDGSVGLGRIWGSGPDDVWVVGSAGTVLHWDGAAWSRSELGVQQSLVALWGSGPNDVWAAATSTMLFHSTGFAGGKANMAPAPAVARADTDARSTGKLIRAIWGRGPADVWVAGDNFTPGAGAPWPPLAGVWRNAVVDGGSGWSPVGSSPVTAMWGSGRGDVWIIGPGINANGEAMVGDGSSSAHTDGAASEDGGVLSWTPVDTQASRRLFAIWGSGPDDVWSVGQFGAIRHVAAGDERWSIVPSPTTSALFGVWGSAANDVWAVGDRGTILHYDGAAWRPSSAQFPPGNVPDLLSVWGSSANDVWAVGGGIVLHFGGRKSSAPAGEKP